MVLGANFKLLWIYRSLGFLIQSWLCSRKVLHDVVLPRLTFLHSVDNIVLIVG